MNKLIVFMIFSASSIAFSQNLQSPDKQLKMIFYISENGTPQYELLLGSEVVINKSNLGLELKNEQGLTSGFSVQNTTPTTFKENWNPVLGEYKTIENHYNGLMIELIQNATNRKVHLHFKLYNEGLAFRYEISTQSNFNYFVVSDEVTQFNLVGNHKAFWIPGDYDSQEYAYNETKLSEIDVLSLDMNNGIGMKGPMTKTRIQSPVMMKTNSGLYITIFEAAVVNYPIMHLDVNTDTFAMQSHLVPNAIGDKAYLQAPAKTPWRTIMVSKDARKILKLSNDIEFK